MQSWLHLASGQQGLLYAAGTHPRGGHVSALGRGSLVSGQALGWVGGPGAGRGLIPPPPPRAHTYTHIPGRQGTRWGWCGRRTEPCTSSSMGRRRGRLPGMCHLLSTLWSTSTARLPRPLSWMMPVRFGGGITRVPGEVGGGQGLGGPGGHCSISGDVGGPGGDGGHCRVSGDVGSWGACKGLGVTVGSQEMLGAYGGGVREGWKVILGAQEMGRGLGVMGESRAWEGLGGQCRVSRDGRGGLCHVGGRAGLGSHYTVLGDVGGALGVIGGGSERGWALL